MGRRTALSGLIGFAIKFSIDRSVAHALGRDRSLINSWYLAGAQLPLSVLAILVTIALPFPGSARP